MTRVTTVMASVEPLDALRFPLWGSRLIEASAGTGKTYTIASLYVRLVLGHGELPDGRSLLPPDILVVTFTRAATKELRDRIRRRLTEAAACFLNEAPGDDFLQELRAEYPPQRWPACARVLQVAAEWMDDAAVDTIDAWCYRMLREHAFDSASLFDLEMDVDEGERVAEATRDYWRLFIAPLEPELFDRVLKLIGSHKPGRFRYAPNDCDTLAATLMRWLPHAHEYADGADPVAALERVRARIEAIKAPWARWAAELHQILQDAYEAGHVDRKKLSKSTWPKWLPALDEWARGPSIEAPFSATNKAWERLTPEGLADAWKEGTPPEHPALHAMLRLRDELREANEHFSCVLQHAARWVADRMAQLRRQRAMVSFSGLTQHLDAALSGPNGARLAAALRKQFPVALIDEFQDTNPHQYRIFERIYDIAANSRSSLLALIGDPKQAIYRFRGADIHAYLTARGHCEGRLYTLGSNYRSSAAMVAAVNHLFLEGETRREQGAFLFRRPEAHVSDNPVPFHPVRAAADPGVWEVDDAPATAMTIWCPVVGRTDVDLDEAPQQSTADGPDNYDDMVAEACASEILRLLQLGAQGKAGFRKGDVFAPLTSGDIAVLVNSRFEAGRLRRELGRRGIRSVYLSDESSVYQSNAAVDVLAWLRACAEPERADFVRAALATAGIGLHWHQLDALVHDEGLWETTVDRFAGYKDDWRRRGVLPMLRQLMHDFDVPARLLAAQQAFDLEGERDLTDFLHLAELLQAASTTLDGEHALIRFLEEHIERGGDPDAEGDMSRMRLEDDAGLVQIVTVHKSKGLEYPLVFYPYAYQGWARKSLELPMQYRTQAAGEVQVVASVAGLDANRQAELLAAAEHERLAEDLRKLYVALTRARHATWVALAPQKELGASAFGYLLGGADACEPHTLLNSLETLVGRCPHIEILDLPEARAGWYVSPVARGTTWYWRSMGRAVPQPWSVSSYSAMARMALDQPGYAASVSSAAAAALPDDAHREVFLEAYAAQAEPDVELAVLDSGADVEIAALPEYRVAPLMQSAARLHDFPRGAGPGSFIHGLLEWLLRQGPQRVLHDAAACRAMVERRCRSRGWLDHAATLTDWLTAFVTQSFHLTLPDVGTQRELVLADLVAPRPEMEFWCGVRDADLPALDAVAVQYCQPDKPRPRITRGRFNGLLRGFIDLAFEHDGRYYVADYKSNWLGAHDDAYHTGALAQAVLAHRYDLQALIYLFALHRLLKARLGERYDYDRHVGGALVFFMRGNHAVSQGLHIERPPFEAIAKLEAIFNNGEKGGAA